jgi:hypothetical protein
MGGMPTQQQVQEQQAKAAQQEEQRKEILQKLLTPEAADRLARIALVKPDKVNRSGRVCDPYLRVPCIAGQFQPCCRTRTRSHLRPRQSSATLAALDAVLLPAHTFGPVLPPFPRRSGSRVRGHGHHDGSKGPGAAAGDRCIHEADARGHLWWGLER